jgi:hypothetical protein
VLEVDPCSAVVAPLVIAAVEAAPLAPLVAASLLALS